MERKELPVGTVNYLSLALNAPFKMDALEMDINKITMLVGKNGSGKSLINKLIWIAGVMSQYCAIHLTGEIVSLANQCTMVAQGTFEDCDLDGTVIVSFKNMDIVMRFAKGLCIHMDYDTFEAVVVPTGLPVYMSTNTRLVTDLISYLRTKKALGINTLLSSCSNDDTEKLITMYRLYDLLFWEGLLRNVWDERSLKPVNDTLKTIMKKPYVATNITFDTVLCKAYLHCDKEIINLATLGSGEQSLLIMAMGTTL